jgi:hypothetical protein
VAEWSRIIQQQGQDVVSTITSCHVMSFNVSADDQTSLNGLPGCMPVVDCLIREPDSRTNEKPGCTNGQEPDGKRGSEKIVERRCNWLWGMHSEHRGYLVQKETTVAENFEVIASDSV